VPVRSCELLLSIVLYYHALIINLSDLICMIPTPSHSKRQHPVPNARSQKQHQVESPLYLVFWTYRTALYIFAKVGNAIYDLLRLALVYLPNRFVCPTLATCRPKWQECTQARAQMQNKPYAGQTAKLLSIKESYPKNTSVPILVLIQSLLSCG
jgi:hypothetical protein